MHTELTAYMDVAQVVLYGFWIFFAGLIFYLRREDKREGYPLQYEGAGPRSGGWFPVLARVQEISAARRACRNLAELEERPRRCACRADGAVARIALRTDRQSDAG